MYNLPDYDLVFERILSIREVADVNDTQVELQIPLKEFEYEIMKNMGAVGHGYSENMPEESKINVKALDEAFKKAKKEAGYQDIPGGSPLPYRLTVPAGSFCASDTRDHSQ